MDVGGHARFRARGYASPGPADTDCYVYFMMGIACFSDRSACAIVDGWRGCRVPYIHTYACTSIIAWLAALLFLSTGSPARADRSRCRALMWV